MSSIRVVEINSTSSDSLNYADHAGNRPECDCGGGDVSVSRLDARGMMVSYFCAAR